MHLHFNNIIAIFTIMSCWSNDECCVCKYNINPCYTLQAIYEHCVFFSFEMKLCYKNSKKVILLELADSSEACIFLIFIDTNYMHIACIEISP